jgi:hypothetical protein
VQLFIVIPSKSHLFIYTVDQKTAFFAYSITLLSIVLAISFFIASKRDPGYLRPQFPFIDLLAKVHAAEMCPDCEVLRT